MQASISPNAQANPSLESPIVSVPSRSSHVAIPSNEKKNGPPKMMCERLTVILKGGVGVSASCSDTDAGFAPMSSLCVVSVVLLVSDFRVFDWSGDRGFGGGFGPVGRFGDVPDSVTSSQSDPLRNRSVLLLSSCELLLRAEGLVALQNRIVSFDIPDFNSVQHGSSPSPVSTILGDPKFPLLGVWGWYIPAS
jgi:hypothetical protein